MDPYLDKTLNLFKFKILKLHSLKFRYALCMIFTNMDPYLDKTLNLLKFKILKLAESLGSFQ